MLVFCGKVEETFKFYGYINKSLFHKELENTQIIGFCTEQCYLDSGYHDKKPIK